VTFADLQGRFFCDFYYDMPKIRGTYNINPSTSVAGLWIQPSGSSTISYMGVTQVSIASITPATLNAGTVATFKTTLQNNLQTVINASHPMGSGAVTATILIKSVSPLLWKANFS